MGDRLIHLILLAGLSIILIAGIKLVTMLKQRHDKRNVIDKSTTPYADWPWPTMPEGNDLIAYKDYREESYEEVTARYDGFGKELFSLIRQRMPDVFIHLKFYTGRNTNEKLDRQYDGCLAEYKKGDVVVIIALSYWYAISLSNRATFVEIQDWGQDYYEEALLKIAEMVGE